MRAFCRIYVPRSGYTFHICLLALAMFSISACSSVPTHKPIAPDVSIASIKPMNISLSGQKLLFTLRVKNNNNYDLPLKSMQFVASLAGEEFARGASNDRVNIPANGEALVDVAVIAGLGALADQLRSIASSETEGVEYALKGLVKLSNWPAAIPFNYKGDAADVVQRKLSTRLLSLRN